MTNKELIQKMYVDFGQGNVPEIVNAMSDDVVIDTPGPAAISWAGVRKGKSGAMDFFQQVGSSASYEKFEPQSFIEEGDKVIAVGSADFTTYATGKKGNATWIMAWTINNGKAVHVKNLWDTNAIMETLK
jgi:ketosteroid isomerase-like protein